MRNDLSDLRLKINFQMANMTVKMKLKPKTPKKVNSAIKIILNELDIHESPFYLSFTLSKNSRAGYCFNNCEDYVKSKKA